MPVPDDSSDRPTNSRTRAPAGDPREAWPTVPRLSAAGRWQGRRGYGLADRLEKLVHRRRLPFPLGPHDRLLRRGGRLTAVRLDPSATGHRAARANLDLVTDACDTGRVPYFLIPGANDVTPRLGIDAEHWDAFLAALAALGAREAVYVAVGAKTRGTFATYAAPPTDPVVSAAMREQPAVDVFRPVATAPGGVHYGSEWGCTVERWTTDAAGALVAPDRNDRAAFVAASRRATATVTRFGRAVDTLDVFTRPLVLDVDFPIDVVYTWVDGDDPDWQRRRAAAGGEQVVPADRDAASDARFRDGGELKYSLRSLAQFAPWVRHVFLVTDRQVPNWLVRDHPRLTVVDHRDLFGDEGTLPTFNSHAIGARLHHIDGLAEHYLYLNDDVFLGRDVAPSAFFEANGLSRFFLSKLSLGYSDPAEQVSHEAARRHVADLVERDFGRTPTNIFYHSPIPQRRSTMAELEARYPDEFRTTWNNQFRAPTDIEPNSWLHHYVGYLLGRAVPGRISYTYIQVGGPTADAQLAQLARRRDRDVFCLNDHVDATAGQHAALDGWLARYYPVPSPFETDSA